jgi:hypothetical protein
MKRVALATLLLASCDPVVNIAGAFFPGWAAACVVGLVLTVGIRQVFVATHLEPHLGPRAVIYPCLAVLLITLLWLVLYRS